MSRILSRKIEAGRKQEKENEGTEKNKLKV